MIDLIKLHALADGELSEEEAKLLREQVLSSEEASRELSAIHNLKDCVRGKAQIFTCETTFAASMRRVAELDRNKRVDRFVTRYAWGISGAFLALIAVGGIMNRTTGSHRVQTADIASVYAGLVPSSSRQPVAPPAGSAGYNEWLQDLVRSANGVARADLDGYQVKMATVATRYGLMRLMIVQGDVVPEGMSQDFNDGQYFTGNIQGHNCVARRAGSRLFILVGDEPTETIFDTLRVLTN